MALQPNYFNDGDYTNGFTPGFDKFSFPFGNYPTPDVLCRVTEQDVRINPICFQPAVGANYQYENNAGPSEDFTNASWSNTGVTFSANSWPNPVDGTNTATKIIESSSLGQHEIHQAAATPSVVNVWSICVRPITKGIAAAFIRQYVILQIFDGASVAYNATFDIINGVVVSTTGNCIAIMANVGGGSKVQNKAGPFYKCIIQTKAAIAAGVGTVYCYISNDGTNVSYQGIVGAGIIADYAQLEYPTDSGNAPGGYVKSTALGGTLGNSTPFCDGTADPFAYLVDEAPMVMTDIQKANVRRTYARIPANQVQFVSKSISRPQPRNTFTNTTGPDAGLAAAPVRVGTFTAPNITIFPSDDGCYIGGCLVTANLKQLFTLVKTVTAITNVNGGFADFTIPSHGYNASNALAQYSVAATPDTLYIINAGDWSVVNSNAIHAPNFVPNICGNFNRNYSPATIIVRARQTESFALPGVTAGISSPTDIALPSQIGNDIDYFTAVSGNTGTNYIPYDFNGPDQWMGNIYKLTKFEVLASDL